MGEGLYIGSWRERKVCGNDDSCTGLVVKNCCQQRLKCKDRKDHVKEHKLRSSNLDPTHCCVLPGKLLSKLQFSFQEGEVKENNSFRCMRRNGNFGAVKKHCLHTTEDIVSGELRLCRGWKSIQT